MIKTCEIKVSFESDKKVRGRNSRIKFGFDEWE
jgi:hypothetical protein